MAISIIEASGTVVNAIVAGYKDKAPATKFLQGFFPAQFRPSKGVKFNVQRRGRPIATDVARFSNGETVKYTKSDQKQFVPPFFKNNVMLNDHELYDNVVGMIAAMNQGIPAGGEALLQANLRAFITDKQEDMMEIQDMQYRAVELMCAQALRTGIIQLNNGDNVDFNRLAGSIADLGAGNYWNTATVDPFSTLETMCRWVRKEGNSGATVFNGLFGVDALNQMKSNPLFQAKMDLKNFNTGFINPPTRPQEGAEYHGRLACGPYQVDVWTYDQYYDHPTTGVSTSYLNEKEVIIIPSDAVFETAWCLVPQVVKANATIPQTEAFLIQQFINEEAGYDKMTIKSAPIPILKSVDRVITYRVAN